MGFRPFGAIAFSLVLTIVLSILLIIPIISYEVDTKEYTLSSSLLIGVVASGLVAVCIEVSGNYRRNKQRLVVLHEYLYVVSIYKEMIEWFLHPIGRIPAFDCGFTNRQFAVACIQLDVVPPIDDALENGREYLYIKEFELIKKIEDASNNMAKETDGIIFENLESKDYPVYSNLKQPFRNTIIEFSEDVGISLIHEDLRSVVFDYYLSHLELLPEYEQSVFKRELNTIDECILQLQKYIKWEPVYYDNLIPMEEKYPDLARLRKETIKNLDI